jgi:hypothetical protein
MHVSVFFRLEDIGPTGIPEKHTSNRAELRTVIAALEFIQTEIALYDSRGFWEPKHCAIGRCN